MMEQKVFHLGLIGWPLEKSLSPVIHEAALREYDLQGEYRLFPVPDDLNPGMELSNLLNRIRDGQHDGYNVTVPYKQKVMEILDQFTDSAIAIGAVNTISKQGGSLIGDNTDARGFISDLAALGILDKLKEHEAVLVLGAGGAARAVAYALSCRGFTVTVAARSTWQAKDLVDNLKESEKGALSQNLHAVPLRKGFLSNMITPSLIVNATTAGMFPDSQGSPWPEGDPFPSGVIVYDLVYKPLDTQFMQRASQAGSEAYNGLGMLIYQAIFSFERWTSILPDPGVIYRALIAAGVITSMPGVRA